MCQKTGFNSLQTGKWIQSNDAATRIDAAEKFQFPSNGKVDSKGADCQDRGNPGGKWFQFPSNGKVDSKEEAARKFLGLEDEFQFPSNGKVDSK